MGLPDAAKLAENDINYYVPRTDPGGPSMSDAVNLIDTSALGTPGCASYVYTDRSYEPFIRDVFDQFSETRTGGAFTFMTGIGGFLQEFLYGYSGMRWGADIVALDPSLNSQIGGIVLHNLQWRGRTFTVAIGQQHDHGQAAEWRAAAGQHARGRRRSLRDGRPRCATRRPAPDLTAPATRPVQPGHREQRPTGRAGAGRRRRQPGDRLGARLVHSTLTARFAGLAAPIRP